VIAGGAYLLKPAMLDALGWLATTVGKEVWPLHPLSAIRTESGTHWRSVIAD
jgi:hypothetical protein